MGHGTSGRADEARLKRIVYGVIGNLPAAQRTSWDGLLSRGLAGRTIGLLGALIDASRLDANRFATRLPDMVGGGTAARIQAAARAAASAQSPEDERAASAALADAVQAVGLDRWARFVAGVEERAGDAAAPQELQPPDPQKDAIRPVYPLETMISIVASALSGGATGAARAIAGSIVRNLPEIRLRPEPPALKVGQQNKHIAGTNNFSPKRSTLTADAQTLLKKFAGRGRRVGKIPVGQAGSKEVFDTGGQVIGIYRDELGRTAPTTRGMIHYAKDGAHIVPSAPNGWVP